jgi:hypothetical protein
MFGDHRPPSWRMGLRPVMMVWASHNSVKVQGEFKLTDHETPGQAENTKKKVAKKRDSGVG